MRTDVAFLLGVFDERGPAAVAAQDFDGPHGAALRAWQERGVVQREPVWHTAATCPHCTEGFPYRLGDYMRCSACRSTIDGRHLLLWPLDLAAFLREVAAHLKLRGGVRPVDERLWQLGTGTAEGKPVECFYVRGGRLSETEGQRLRAYRHLVVWFGPSGPPPEQQPGQWFPLIDLFDADGTLVAADLDSRLRPAGNVRFDVPSGVLWAGDLWLGEVPVGSREYHLLACLAEHLDHFVSYADLQREVLRRTAGADAADEATFCHGLKRRIKGKWVPNIDRLVVTTNKGDGYRLRRYMA
jgi:hypothetical protein